MLNALPILLQFEPISLSEMDHVKLMNRTDTKYTFNRCHFEKVMSDVLNDYRILEVDGQRLSRYKSLYYDTDNFSLYATHHKGKLNRHKIRHRTYLESKTGFLEVKFKNNKGRTLKDRIREEEAPLAWNESSSSFLKKKLPFEPGILKPVLWVNYNRLTLVSKNSPERLTIDLNLEFVFGERSEQMGELVIAEVKQEKRQASPFVKVMKKYHIREGGISKYCLGIALTNPDVKKNNFKSKLLRLKHIIYDSNTTSPK